MLGRRRFIYFLNVRLIEWRDICFLLKLLFWSIRVKSNQRPYFFHMRSRPWFALRPTRPREDPPRPLKSRPFFWILYACSRACAALSDHVLLTPSLAHSGSLQEFHASFQKKKPAISRARILYCNSPWAILMVLGLLAMLDLQVEIFGLEPIPIWSIKDWVFKSAWVIGCLLIQEHKASSSWLHPFLIT